MISNHNFNFTAAVVSTSGEEDQELEKGNLEFTWKDAWLFLFPAVCDVTATSGPIFFIRLTDFLNYVPGRVQAKS